VNASAKVTRNTEIEATAIFPASLRGARGWEFEATYIIKCLIVSMQKGVYIDLTCCNIIILLLTTTKDIAEKVYYYICQGQRL
jgi:hypothetical protein